MGVCISCNTPVPLNTPNCLVCEAPLGPQNVPQASMRLADKLLCTKCGTPNPPNLRNCFVCEASLPAAGKVPYISFKSEAIDLPTADKYRHKAILQSTILIGQHVQGPSPCCSRGTVAELMGFSASNGKSMGSDLHSGGHCVSTLSKSLAHRCSVAQCHQCSVVGSCVHS